MQTSPALEYAAGALVHRCLSIPALRGPGTASRFAKPAPEARVGQRRWSPIQPIYRPTKGGAAGAGKIIGTDYWLAGPGRATRKPVGRGVPRTPSPEGGIA
jgi:hypothetical protein